MWLWVMVSRLFDLIQELTWAQSFLLIAGHATYPLLFDPQTSGGLLIALSPDVADECINALKVAGYLSASLIGRVVARDDGEFSK